MEYNLEEVGKRIKSLRKNRTQKTYSKELGITQGTLSRIEKGILDPGCDLILEISEKEKVPIDWIVTGEKDQKYKDFILREPLIEYGFLPTSMKKLLDNVREILESGNEVMADALKANIKAFLQAVRSTQKKNEDKGSD